MNELKPCPFCGGVAALVEIAPEEGDVGYRSNVNCLAKDCGAIIRVAKLSRNNANKSAIQLWNRRINNHE